jgi:hypothetical protein
VMGTTESIAVLRLAVDVQPQHSVWKGYTSLARRCGG